MHRDTTLSVAIAMAEQALKKLEEQLNCSICLDTFTDPKLLQCFHVYCQQCLVRLVVRDQQRKLGLTCPTCRQVTPIPDTGVAGLPPAFYINHLLDIQASLQQVENPTTTPEGAASINVFSQDDSVGCCFEHPEEELKLYCETCGKLVCFQCGLKGGKHRDHEYVPVKEAFEKYKKEITASLEPMEKQVMTIKKALAQLDKCYEEISNQRAASADSIQDSFKQLYEVLHLRETELIGQLDQVTQGKLKGLAAQRDQIETTLARLNSCLHFMKESLRTTKERDVLMMKANTVERVEELTTPFQQDYLEPNTEADIVFSASTSLRIECQNYGQVLSPGSLDPPRCHTTGKGAEVAAVGEKSTVTLHAVNSEGAPCQEPIKLLEYELVSEITGTRASCSVERRGQSQYEISYQPTIKGRHQLHIRAEGQHVRGSPFSVAAKAPIEELGAPILIIGEVARPWGVAINHRGEVVVTEYGGFCVSVFSPSGEKLRSFGRHGAGEGQFKYPEGVTVDGEGNILVCDCGNDRIQKLSADGEYITAVGARGSQPLQFVSPVGVAFNASNNKVYIADTGNHRVQVLNFDITLYSMFGKKGSGKGQFNEPLGIACDSTGKVYVADAENHRIQVFTAEGKFLRMFGRYGRGRGRGELDYPSDVAIDASGMVYVSEWDNHRVSVFTPDGVFVTAYGRKGWRPGQFESPTGLAVDSSGVVYVCDYNRVQMF